MSNDDQKRNNVTGDNTNNEVDVQELPKLNGAKKLKRWAYQIRSHYKQIAPDSALLYEKVDVQFWIDNRISLIGDVKLEKSFPPLIGGTDNQKRWAVAIRAKFADTFPENRLMYSQTQTKFWIDNRKIFDFALLGYNKALDDKSCLDSE